MGLLRRRVVLGVSGGIAAYKAVYLARLLIEAGAEVRVVMTEAATDFIGGTTFAALTGHPVTTEFVGNDWTMSPHVDLGQWADVIVVAPATAATLSRLAGGLSEDPLSASVLASDAPLVVAPAMHSDMWENPATQRSIETLVSDGAIVVGPGEGHLAGGDSGVGRMSEPEEILEAIEGAFKGLLTGVPMVVTAGGTREPIDPVRYLGNRSSGKMGHALAEEAAAVGADVTLITASDLPVSHLVKRIDVETAVEMDEAVKATPCEVAVMAAAVADFRPANPSVVKLSRQDGPPNIRLEPNPDILAGVVARDPKPFVVGFAAEVGGIERVVEKARDKGADLIVANDVTEEGAGFGGDTNRVTIVTPDGGIEEWPLAPKTEIARRIVRMIEERLRG